MRLPHHKRWEDVAMRDDPTVSIICHFSIWGCDDRGQSRGPLQNEDVHGAFKQGLYQSQTKNLVVWKRLKKYIKLNKQTKHWSFFFEKCLCVSTLWGGMADVWWQNCMLILCVLMTLLLLFLFLFFISPRQRILWCKRNKISNSINKQNIDHFSLKNVCVSTLEGGGGRWCLMTNLWMLMLCVLV